MVLGESPKTCVTALVPSFATVSEPILALLRGAAPGRATKDQDKVKRSYVFVSPVKPQNTKQE